MDIQIIDTGYFYADGGAMLGAIPKTAALPQQRNQRLRPGNEEPACIKRSRKSDPYRQRSRHETSPATELL